MSDPLDQLLAIINSGVGEIKSTYEPYTASELEHKVAATTALVVAAAEQLVATIRLPTESIYDAASGVRLVCLSEPHYAC
jgi:hypothetical protein